MAGALKTLFATLQTSSFLTTPGITLVYGLEEINQQRYNLPCVIMTAVGGPYEAPGYAGGVDPAVEMLWETRERVEFWCLSASTDPNNSGAIDHVDAIETARLSVLSALRDQRAQANADGVSASYGLAYSVISGRWEVIGDNQTSPFGRAYVLSIDLRISMPMAVVGGPEATITTVAVAQNFNDKPAT